MAERPILFSGPMVRAILSGTKTQTRRVLNPQPHTAWAGIGCLWYPRGPEHRRSMAYDGEDHFRRGVVRDFCPFGVPGDRLWVRETWAPVSPHEGEAPLKECRIEYRADVPEGHLPGDWHNAEPGDPDIIRWRPSIHMPRWASRITLEITDVRVERLTSISDEDARSEGITSRGPRLWRADWSGLGTPSVYATGGRPGAPAPLTEEDLALSTPRHAFGHLWDSINGNRPGCSWADDPWVWVMSFRRVEVPHG